MITSGPDRRDGAHRLQQSGAFDLGLGNGGHRHRCTIDVQTRLQSGGGQQIAHQPTGTPSFADQQQFKPLPGLGVQLVAVVEQRLRRGLHTRDRRTQLVRGVGQKHASLLFGLAGTPFRTLQFVEHVVERFGSPADLGVGPAR